MKDRLNREINYMRLSVTDRCNLRCFYCRPVEDKEFIPPEEILSYDEFLKLIQVAIELGITRFRLTGGEPLLRPGIDEFIAQIKSLSGIDDLALTTNGLLLEENLDKLWQAGLRRINISLDTLDEKKYGAITGSYSLRQVLRAIKMAIEKGFHPVKINVVLLKGINENIDDFINLAYELPLHIRFIELMSFSSSNSYFLSAEKVLQMVKKKGQLKLIKLPGSGPARYYQLPGMKGSLGFITPYSDHFCATCNRLRVSARGELRTCLFSNETYDLKFFLRTKTSTHEIKNFLQTILSHKPMSWHQLHGKRKRENMRQIGG
ncbi:MAG: GTP 3',8-cyclase MoaA [Candidatus Aminicenantes bacterium]|nr:GTP 3',8-cyclase MoaA [Candidatus Aminicenantes bacterium]